MLPNWFLLASGYPDSEVKYGKRFLESDLTESSICVDTDGLTAIRHERVDKNAIESATLVARPARTAPVDAQCDDVVRVVAVDAKTDATTTTRRAGNRRPTCRARARRSTMTR